MIRDYWRVPVLGSLLIGMLASTAVAEIKVDDPMFQDPNLILPDWGPEFSAELKPLWNKALSRPESGTRRLAADTITQAIHRGMTGFEDLTGKLEELAKSDPEPLVRRAAARSLIALESKVSASVLSEAAVKDGLLMSQFVEPTLARWNDDSFREQWLNRLDNPTVEQGFLLLAIECLAIRRDSQATPSLTAWVQNNDASPEIRLAAAQALGQINTSGLAGLASDLANRSLRPDFLGPLLATRVMSRHADQAAIEILQRLAEHAEPSVATAALARLHEIELKWALPFARGVIARPDAGLRRLGAQLLVEQGDADALVLLAPMLDDHNPGVRQFVAQKFVEFHGQEGLKPVVIEQTVKMLATDQWRGLEQAALIVGQLDYEPAVARILELLKHPRGEVAVAAAWAIRKLAIRETLPELLAFAESLHTQVMAFESPDHLDVQVSQLFQAFGEMRYLEAETFMRKFVPKTNFDVVARAAACWTLGLLHEERPDDDLARQFAERLADVGSMPPEWPRVRQMCATSIGRMKAESQMPVLRNFAKLDTQSSPTGLACAWGIERTTGEKIDPSPPLRFSVRGWFLEPADRQ